MTLKFKRAFTLIELLVVFSIISMLSSVVLASMSIARLKAQNARIVQETMQLRNAFELTYNGSSYSAFSIAAPVGVGVPAITGIVAQNNFSGSIATLITTILSHNSGLYGGGYNGGSSGTLTNPCPAVANVEYYNISVNGGDWDNRGHATNGLTVYTYPSCGPVTKYAIYSMYTPIKKVAFDSIINTAYALVVGDIRSDFSGYFCVDSSGKSLFGTGWIPAKVIDGQCQ